MSDNKEGQKQVPKGKSLWNDAGTWEERKIDVDELKSFLNSNKGKLKRSS